MKGFFAGFLLVSLLGAPTLAQPAKTAAPAKTPARDPLDIPMFAAVPNEFVFAGTNKDLLAIFQKVAGDNPAETLKGDPRLQIVRDAQTVMSSIHVLRVRSVSFRGQGDEGYEKALDAAAAKIEPVPLPVEPESGGSSLDSGDKLYDREQRRLAEAEKFYTDFFVKQGGKTRLQLKSGKTSIALYAFSQPRTFAVVTCGPSRVIVARADGLPDLAAIAKIFQGVTSPK